ncbi:MAG: 4Fe-4S binding protein [Methanobrevibacter boviskoreani]|jgi:heterodisulfide reductase subunit A|uniref:CoB--CoM heterodisulfide reductase iron-sulfur subunit A family protein n=1 Tax=Methanobrevibacter boviskoreani TaxID=1348249 RepID=UPI00059347FB|nr:CoB--CoM heterodisulfide reductase iron-sulfur subunit A family protein [Methanobrevibacter boviskoreani]MCI6775581.1 CoB--CoM heterodisulfide reductase iron-sulfur subunit A family protein [Methanobrevibacter boviskoreani]MCI6930495.1 CoB--CoM heterodisulfide reductase iron-sulfur subunit A family protein [Methanobrevibacter boviskoreani]MDD6257019.1 CoB--CoM heterodisulfide reductase iron-sulfur subunit A family protein [Methanobrevibacter boviskoreani]MDY5614864.1 CoB--CoM heterodisulfide
MAEEKNNENEELRIGVYVCHCGVNIAAAVDCEAVAEYAGTLPNVVVAKDYKYMCSDPGQNLIQEDIKEQNLNRVVVAACSPRLHEPTFRRCVEEAGLNRYLFEFANLREHDSWVHMNEPEAATEKAKDLVRMAVAKVRLLEPLEPHMVDVNNNALVIGGGVTGIQTALDLGDMGFHTYLVERNPTISGRMGQLDKTFPTLDCSMCILAPKMVDCGKHENIELITYAEVTDVDGYIGNFTVTVNKKARYVDEETCTGCGQCTEVCPIEIPNYFDEGIGMTKAAYIPFPQAVPLCATIDKDYCIECGLCVSACERGSIDLDQQPEEIKLEVGTIIAATGYDPYDPSGKYEYGYGRYSNVITGLEIERMINASGPTTGHVIKPSDGETPKRVAFIHCVGSRDEQIGKPYCSRVCCMYSMKNAQLCIDHEPDTEVTCYYMDIRAFGKGFEEFYKTSQEKYGIEFLRGRPAQIIENDDLTLTIRAEDTLLGKVTEYTYDLVVLSVGLEPPAGSNELRQTLGISKSSDGFYMEAHPKLRPVDTLTDGVYIAGVAQGPKDIPDSVAQGSAAAARAAIPMSQGKVAIEPIIASSDENLCGACEVCVELCPFSAISIVGEEGAKHAEINAALCKGCGTCVGACPSGAMDQNHFKTDQIMAQIDAAFEDM